MGKRPTQHKFTSPREPVIELQPHAGKGLLQAGQLSENEQLSRSIVETVDDGIIAFYDRGVVLLLNPAAQKMFGHRAGEVVGRSVKELIADSSHAQFDGYVADCLRAARGTTIGRDREIAGRRKDGSTFPMDLAVTAFMLDGHCAIAATARDITERKRADETIRRLATVLADSNDALTVHDLDGRITAWNRGAVRMYGYSRDEALAMNIGAIVPPAARAEAMALLERLAGGEEVDSFETQRVTRDGRVLDVWLTVTTLRDEGGKPIAVATTERDVTERKWAEQELRGNEQRLRSLTSELSLAQERERRRIATDLHNQIGGTLAAVKIKLGQLRRVVAAFEVRQPLIEIRDLIDATIKSTRSLTFDLASPLLYEVGLEAALDGLADQIQEQHGIQSHFQDDGQPKPMADELKVVLYQSVRELLVNVAKHSQARSVHVSICRDLDNVRIRVSDDGVGFKTPDTGFHVSRHGGFGLYHASECLTHVGGRLQVESTPGRGTAVTVVAPLAAARPVDDPTPR